MYPFRICRLCGTELKVGRSINCLNAPELSLKIEKVLKIKITKNDPCTTNSCADCSKKVMQFATFVSIFENTQLVINEFLKTNQELNGILGVERENASKTGVFDVDDVEERVIEPCGEPPNGKCLQRPVPVNGAKSLDETSKKVVNNTEIGNKKNDTKIVNNITNNPNLVGIIQTNLTNNASNSVDESSSINVNCVEKQQIDEPSVIDLNSDSETENKQILNDESSKSEQVVNRRVFSKKRRRFASNSDNDSEWDSITNKENPSSETETEEPFNIQLKESNSTDNAQRLIEKRPRPKRIARRRVKYNDNSDNNSEDDTDTYGGYKLATKEHLVNNEAILICNVCNIQTKTLRERAYHQSFHLNMICEHCGLKPNVITDIYTHFYNCYLLHCSDINFLMKYTKQCSIPLEKLQFPSDIISDPPRERKFSNASHKNTALKIIQKVMAEREQNETNKLNTTNNDIIDLDEYFDGEANTSNKDRKTYPGKQKTQKKSNNNLQKGQMNPLFQNRVAKFKILSPNELNNKLPKIAAVTSLHHEQNEYTVENKQLQFEVLPGKKHGEVQIRFHPDTVTSQSINNVQKFDNVMNTQQNVEPTQSRVLQTQSSVVQTQQNLVLTQSNVVQTTHNHVVQHNLMQSNVVQAAHPHAVQQNLMQTHQNLVQTQSNVVQSHQHVMQHNVMQTLQPVQIQIQTYQPRIVQMNPSSVMHSVLTPISSTQLYDQQQNPQQQLQMNLEQQQPIEATTEQRNQHAQQQPNSSNTENEETRNIVIKVFQRRDGARVMSLFHGNKTSIDIKSVTQTEIDIFRRNLKKDELDKLKAMFNGAELYGDTKEILRKIMAKDVLEQYFPFMLKEF